MPMLRLAYEASLCKMVGPFFPPLSYISCIINFVHNLVRSTNLSCLQSEHEGSGIISNAIANAEKLRPQGQENVSLLQQHSSANKTPTSTQFTFTCDSQVPGTVQWPGKLRQTLQIIG